MSMNKLFARPALLAGRTPMGTARLAPLAVLLFLSCTPVWCGSVKQSFSISGTMGVLGSLSTTDFKAFDPTRGTLVKISVRLTGKLNYTGKGIPADEGATLGLADPKRDPDLAFDFFPKVGSKLNLTLVNLDITDSAVLSDYTGTGMRNLAVNDVGGNATDHYKLTGSGTVTYVYVAAPAPPVFAWHGTIARLSVTVAGPVTPPPGAPVEADLGFTDLAGNLIGSMTPVTLFPGQVASVDLDANQLVHAAGQYVAVRPRITFPAGGVVASLNATTEIFDAQTGIGRVLTTTTSLAPDTPTFSPQGIAGGQFLRIAASAALSDPCSATLSFTDRNGSPVGQSRQVDLAPGQLQVLDLDASALGLESGMRTEVQPVVTLPESSAASACAVSAQAIDRATGQSGTYQAIVVSQ